MESKYEWIHDLIKAEEEIEETGIFDFGNAIDPERTKVGAALTFLAELKQGFSEATELFNGLKSNPGARIKVYSVAKTHADFMLFRSGFKLIFSLKQAGIISVRTHFLNPSLPSVATMNLMGAQDPNHFISPQFRGEEDQLEFKWGPFQEIIWTFKGQPIKSDSVIRYYLTKFIQETANPGN